MPLVQDAENFAIKMRQLEGVPYVAIDTEFIRDHTYYPELCLVQLATPDIAFAIDPLAGFDLKPLYALLANPSITKVFHACRQDIEIFFHATGEVPQNVFDTQVAAQVLGYGDSVSYAELVKKECGATIDKSSRYTNWAARPLTPEQTDYALSDVTYLCKVYEKFCTRLKMEEREEWFAEELKTATAKESYDTNPLEAWRKLRLRSNAPHFLGRVKMLAAWREMAARAKNVPKTRILRDDQLLEIAASRVKTMEDLTKVRGVRVGGSLAEGVMEALKKADALPKSEIPVLEDKKPSPVGTAALVELLKIILRLQAETHHVADRLVATNDELEAFAALQEEALENPTYVADIRFLHGWRYEVFGHAALELREGKIALTADRKGISLIRTEAH